MREAVHTHETVETSGLIDCSNVKDGTPSQAIMRLNRHGRYVSEQYVRGNAMTAALRAVAAPLSEVRRLTIDVNDDARRLLGNPNVFAGNHLRKRDTILGITALIKLGVPIRPLVAIDGSATKLESAMLEIATGVIWTDRRMNDEARDRRQAAYYECVSWLKRGGSILIRPSSVYSPYLDIESPYYVGAVKMAIEAGAARIADGETPVGVIPVTQEYSLHTRPYFAVERPFDLSTYTSNNEDLVDATEQLQHRVESNRIALRHLHGIELTHSQFHYMWMRAGRECPDHMNGYTCLRGFRRHPDQLREWWFNGDAFDDTG